MAEILPITTVFSVDEYTWVVNKVVATLLGRDHVHAHEVRDSRSWWLELLLMRGVMKQLVWQEVLLLCAVE
jgi:hypothetical protein